jgi:hypothetical protein
VFAKEEIPATNLTFVFSSTPEPVAIVRLYSMSLDSITWLSNECLYVACSYLARVEIEQEHRFESLFAFVN